MCVSELEDFNLRSGVLYSRCHV